MKYLYKDKKGIVLPSVWDGSKFTVTIFQSTNENLSLQDIRTEHINNTPEYNMYDKISRMVVKCSAVCNLFQPIQSLEEEN